MNSINTIQKSIIKIIFSIRSIIPKKIHRTFGKLIKKKKILNILFSLQYGVFVSPSKHYIRMIPLKKRILTKPLLILDIPSLDTYWEIFIDQSYEKYNPINPDDVVLDIGANIGMFTIKAAQNIGENGRILAIEPEVKNIILLKENTKDLKNVFIITRAVGNTTGEEDLLVFPLSGTHFIAPGVKPNTGQKIKRVKIDKIDNIVREFGLDIINFVKIDVEGWEMQVLKGAENSLGKIKFFSIGSYHTVSQKHEITEFLEKRNFKVLNDKDKTYAWNLKFMEPS